MRILLFDNGTSNNSRNNNSRLFRSFFFTGSERNYNMKNKGFGYRWTEVNDISQLSALFGNEHFTPQDRLKTIKEELCPSIVEMIKKVAFCYLRVMLIHFYY